MKDEKPTEVLIVNKQVFIASIQALGAFLEAQGDSFENIRRSKLDPQQKHVILSLLSENIQAISQITEGFKMSLSKPLESSLIAESIN